MPRHDGEYCRTCRFAELEAGGAGFPSPLYSCHRFPPPYRSRMPIVQGDNWCGEFVWDEVTDPFPEPHDAIEGEVGIVHNYGGHTSESMVIANRSPFRMLDNERLTS